MLHTHKSGRKLQDSVAIAMAMEVAVLERSQVSELRRAQERKRIMRRMEPHRMRRIRIVLDGIRNERGDAVSSARGVGNSIASEWMSIFGARVTDLASSECYLSFVLNGARTQSAGGSTEEVAQLGPRCQKLRHGRTHLRAAKGCMRGRLVSSH